MKAFETEVGYPRECWDRADSRDSGISASWVVLVRGISGLGIDGINQQQESWVWLMLLIWEITSNILFLIMSGEWFIIFIILRPDVSAEVESLLTKYSSELDVNKLILHLVGCSSLRYHSLTLEILHSVSLLKNPSSSVSPP